MNNGYINKVDYCDICGSVMLREKDKQSCIKCGGPMTEIGWVEKNER